MTNNIGINKFTKQPHIKQRPDIKSKDNWKQIYFLRLNNTLTCKFLNLQTTAKIYRSNIWKMQFFRKNIPNIQFNN